jgi:hypothetical protein
MPRAKKQEPTSGVNRGGLLLVLNKLKPGLAAKDVIDQATCVVFHDGLAWSFDDEVAVSHPLPEGLEKITGAVPADPLMQFLARSKADTVEIEAVGAATEDDPNATELRLKAGRAKVGIAMREITLPVHEIPVPEKEEDWKPLPDDFVKYASLAALACSSDSSSPALCCLYITAGAIWACDNYRLTQVALSDDMGTFLLPSSYVRYMRDFSPDSYALADGWLHLINKDEVVMSCRTTSGKYPDVAGLLEIEGQQVKLPEGLEDVLARAEVFAEAEYREEEEVRLEADGTGVLMVRAQGTAGWVEEELTIERAAGKFAFPVSPALLADALTLDRNVTLSDGAILIEGENFKHVVSLA